LCTDVTQRRRILRTACGVALVPLAGCPTSDEGGDGEDEAAAGNETTETANVEDEPEATAGEDTASGGDGNETDDGETPGTDGDGEIDAKTVTSVTDGDRVVELLTADHFAGAGEIRETDDDEFRYYMNVETNEEGQESFDQGLEEIGAYDDHEGKTIRTHVDGEVVVEFPLDEELVNQVESGEWKGRLMMFFRKRENAEAVRDAITSG
jgi:hypothetical protein